MRKIKIIGTASILVLSLVGAAASVISISIPGNSQNPLCRPSYDNNWSVTVSQFSVNTNAGIGIIMNPEWISSDNNQDFALHPNNEIQPSPLYAAPNVPDPKTAAITYTFDRPEIISGVEIVQHVNGITEVEGFLGNSTNALVSIGAVFGPSGNITDGAWVVPSDGTAQVFNFDNTRVSGTVLRVIIRKTSHPSAFATHRIYPLDEKGVPISLARTTSPLLGTSGFGWSTNTPEALIADSESQSPFRLIFPAFVFNSNFQFSVVGVAGSQCKIQTSTNLNDWVTVLTNTVPFTFTTNKSNADKQCFYRAVYLP
jgi:hypothetical protein